MRANPDQPWIEDGPGAAPPGLLRSVVPLVLAFTALNLVLFLLYRFAFLARFVGDAAEGNTGRVLLSGARLDLALLSMELCVAGLLSILTLAIRLRPIYLLLVGFTLLNTLATIADFQFYEERNQHMGELLVAHLTDAHVLGTELSAWFATRTLTAALTLGGGALLLILLLRLRFRIPPLVWDLKRAPVRLLLVLLATALLVLPTREVVASKKEKGWTSVWVSSRHYATLGSYLPHQALQNPFHELLVVHVGRLFLSPPEPTLGAEQAEAVCRARLPGPATTAEFPLLCEVESTFDLGLENVLIVQVEGLTASLLDQEEDGRPVTPVLRRLAAEGISFPNAVQSFSNTAGGVFSLVTGLPRALLEEGKHRTFAAPEEEGYFASLPRLFPGERRQNLFLAGFRQSHYAYTAFLGNQGFDARGYPRLAARIKTGDESQNRLGFYDGALFSETARAIEADPLPFTAYVLTASTHSPWTVPAEFEGRFTDRKLNAFHYLDASLGRLLDRLGGDETRHRKTLVVVTADHTSPTFTKTFLERLRVPLIFWAPEFAERGLAGPRDIRATHLDVVPTVLALMGGKRPYAGLGRSLLDPAAPEGAISGSRTEWYYFSGSHVLVWRRMPEEVRLHELVGEELGAEDLAARRPGLFHRMKMEFFAQFESARRLSLQKRVFPLRR